MKRLRSAVVIVKDGEVALIKRINARDIYHLFPGGRVETGETIRDAAIREAHEELGVTVRLGALLSIVHFGESEQYYFAADVTSGSFGTGKGEELASPTKSESGSYAPVWLPYTALTQHDVRPVHLARLIEANLLILVPKPVVIEETAF